MSTLFPHPLLTLHVGQAGIQIGHACWELMCLEHNINRDGTPRLECGDHGNVDTMFLPTPQGRYFPRSLFVDTDPFCVDEVRSGPYRGLFSSQQLLSDELDSGTNYATGRYGYTRRLLPETLDRLRWLTEKADVKPTVLLLHSACGGTGSGFAVACLSQAADDLGLSGQNTLDLCVVPGRMACQTSCELLNTALYMDEAQSLVRQTICVSNSALFRVCSVQLQSREGATYAHVNRILAAAFSNLTATERLPGSSVSLSGVLDSLLPFPHLKYPLLACAPFMTHQMASVEQPTVRSATAAVLESGSQFLDVDPRQGSHSAGFLLYRGAAPFVDVQRAAAELTTKGRVRFADWAPAGFRTGVVALPPLVPPGSGFADPALSVTMLASHTGISKVFQRFAQTARRLQESDLFVHSYEGAIVSLLTRKSSRLSGHHAKDDSEAVASSPSDVANSSLRDWMSPSSTARSDSGLVPPAQRQHLRRREAASGSQQPRSSADHRAPESGAVRSCAISDVFGVRVRLTMAIDYLEAMGRVYAEGGGLLPPALDTEDDPPSGDGNVQIVWQDGASEEGGDAGPVTVVASSSSSSDEVHQGQQKGGPVPEASDVLKGENAAASEYESTVRWAAQLEQTDDDTPRSIQQQQQLDPQDDSNSRNVKAAVGQQQQQSQHQPEDNDDDHKPPGWSSDSDDRDVTSTTAAAPGAASKTRRVGAGCLRRKKAGNNWLLAKLTSGQKQQPQQPQPQPQPEEPQFSWSPRHPGPSAHATPDRHPAVVQAEKILMKYHLED